jgi:hypothetical protein
MKVYFRKQLALLLICTLNLSPLGCATVPTKQVRLPKSESYSFAPHKTYKVFLNEGEVKRRYKGSKLQWKNNQLSLMKSSHLSWSGDEIQEIVTRGDERIGSYWREGFGIGAVAGIVLGLVGALASNCDGADEVDDCENLLVLAAIAFPIAFGTLGGVTGLTIGFIVPKKEEVILTPTRSAWWKKSSTPSLSLNWKF